MFVQKQEQAILKPLDGMGGHSIFRSSNGDPNLNVILETLTDGGRTLAIAQRYLQQIIEGDKRILLIDGVPIDHCLARIPQGDEFRGNMAAGGRGESRPQRTRPLDRCSSRARDATPWHAFCRNRRDRRLLD